MESLIVFNCHVNFVHEFHIFGIYIYQSNRAMKNPKYPKSLKGIIIKLGKVDGIRQLCAPDAYNLKPRFPELCTGYLLSAEQYSIL
jgi:hypothetical protein